MATGLVVILAFFGIFGGWAALAPLDSAAVTQGVVKVEGERKVIQHLEGGIVSQLKVADGEHVKSGQVLIKLDDTQAAAHLELLRNRVISRKASAARLRAERDGKDEIAFEQELLTSSSSPAAEAVAVQNEVFRARRLALSNETGILHQRILQSENEIKGLEDMVAAQDQVMVSIEAEAADLEKLSKKGLATRERHLQLRRRQGELKGERATNIAAIARIRESMAEIEQQIMNLSTTRLNEAVAELSKVEAELFDLQQQLRAAEDVLARADIRAPVDGVVMGLQVHTAGGVVRPGEPLMSIVPVGQKLVVEAMVRPEDVDTIAIGQSAHVRISAFARYDMPPLEGRVELVSADRLTDDRTGAGYFTAIIVVDEQELGKLAGRKLLPGMTSEVMIRTGSRTMLAYIGEPLARTFRRAMREN
ncbi:HlyD family type I secretion periplasmic adaptor subunit [Ensifer sesbaniae]|uniref:HlyD family type I secretion periplasmic adaptor subunit n=1 Tax=Ensifer sesbaniae TaxID=1214071 RepID=UPI002896893A|nr:HlyD family type I secretion periplasmic adaptor subunit [Ensifer sesbaniae]